jgi:zinc/manganese transport system substrate-binding protein
MRTILNTRVALAMVVGLATVATGGCSSTGVAPGGRVRVVAAENFWGSIAAQVAGPDAGVTSIIRNPETDPHGYEPTPRDARAFAGAQLVIENGIGYDPWAQQLLDANPVSDRTVLNVGRLLGVADGGNPHQWYSQAAVAKFIERVATDLEAVDPGHRAGYRRRARELESTGLAQYSALITQIRREYAHASIGASESIVTPLALTLDLRVVTPRAFLDAIAEGNEPTAGDKAIVDSQIAQHRIEVFVYNSQNATPDVQRLVDAARREHIPVATVTETLTPANASFQSWQVRELRELLGALKRATVR